MVGGDDGRRIDDSHLWPKGPDRLVLRSLAPLACEGAEAHVVYLAAACGAAPAGVVAGLQGLEGVGVQVLEAFEGRRLEILDRQHAQVMDLLGHGEGAGRAHVGETGVDLHAFVVVAHLGLELRGVGGL